MKNRFLSYFPDNKHTWKKFILTSLPAILAALVFSLNSFIDNFMSTNIDGGNQALAYANTWTELLVGIIGITSMVGSVIFAQYLGKRDFVKVKEVIHVRILFSLSIALLFVIPAWITPVGMVQLISGFDPNLNGDLIDIRNSSALYLRIITASWLLNTLWYTLAMIMREKHHATASFIASVISLVTNIILNSIFVYALHKGLEFLAISTIVSNLFGMGFVIIFIYWKDREIAINPLKIFKVSKEVLSHFFKRISSFIFLTIGSLAVNLRFVLWNKSYPTGSIGEVCYQLSAANILGITGMFFNIFWTTFESISSNVAIYVGKELGNNNFDEARKNARQLQGFHLIVALIMGLLFFCFSFAIEQMDFLADGYRKSLEQYLNTNPGCGNSEEIINNAIQVFLSTMKYTTWPLAFFMPMFIWFITRNRVISSGGFTRVVAITEASAGTLQLGWLALTGLVFNSVQHPLIFPLAYFIFFLSDIPKFVVYEILNKKIDWVKNIVHEDEINIADTDIDVSKL